MKRKADGFIEHYKGRLVAQGFSQRPGFDYTETFAPTPQWAAIRAILALVAFEDLYLESVDISSAFLNGKLQEEVYMHQPEGFVERDKTWVWHLIKSIYGLRTLLAQQAQQGVGVYGIQEDSLLTQHMDIQKG